MDGQMTPAEGLSPRVRGNLPPKNPLKRRARSIPACAGEPSLTTLLDVVRGVYPRVCGGTTTTTQAEIPDGGLSPRVRGNPPHSGGIGKR